MAGNVTSVPPPATELTALPIAAARKMRMNDGMDTAGVQPNRCEECVRRAMLIGLSIVRADETLSLTF